MLWMHTSGSDWTQTVTPLTRWRHVLPWKCLLGEIGINFNLCQHKLCKVYPNVPQSTNTLTICWDHQLHSDQQMSLRVNKSTCTQQSFKSRERLPPYRRLLIRSWSSIPERTAPVPVPQLVSFPDNFLLTEGENSLVSGLVYLHFEHQGLTLQLDHFIRVNTFIGTGMKVFLSTVYVTSCIAQNTPLTRLHSLPPCAGNETAPHMYWEQDCPLYYHHFFSKVCFIGHKITCGGVPSKISFTEC